MKNYTSADKNYQQCQDSTVPVDFEQDVSDKKKPNKVNRRHNNFNKSSLCSTQFMWNLNRGETYTSALPNPANCLPCLPGAGGLLGLSVGCLTGICITMSSLSESFHR